MVTQETDKNIRGERKSTTTQSQSITAAETQVDTTPAAQEFEILPACATFSQLRESDLADATFQTLDGLVEAGINQYKLHELEARKILRTLAPVIVRIHDALSDQGKRTDIDGTPEGLTWTQWMESKRRIASKATFGRIIAEAGCKPLPQLTDGSPVTFPDPEHKNVIREGVVRRKHQTSDKVDVEYTTKQGTVTKTATIPAEVITPIPQPKYKRLKEGELFLDETNTLYVWKNGAAIVSADQSYRANIQKEKESKQAEAKKRLEDLQAAKAGEKAKKEELKKQQQIVMREEAVAKRLSRRKVNEISEPLENKNKSPRKNTKNVEEALIAQGVKLDVPLSELRTKRTPVWMKAHCRDGGEHDYGVFNIAVTGDVFTKTNAVFLGKATAVDAEYNQRIADAKG